MYRVCFHIYNGKSKTLQVSHELWLHEYLVKYITLSLLWVSTFTILNLQERVRHKVDRWNIQCQVCVRHLTADCWITVKLIAGCCKLINCNKLLRHLTFNGPRNQAHSSNHRQQGIHPATAVQTARAEFNSGFFISSLFIPLFCANNTGYLESIMIYGQPHVTSEEFYPKMLLMFVTRSDESSLHDKPTIYFLFCAYTWSAK